MFVGTCVAGACIISAGGAKCRGALIREVIEGGPVGWPETYSVAAMIAGLSDELGQAIGISALGGGADNTPVVEATFAADDRAAFTADAAEILAQLPEPP
jgi:hypothetical protein